MLRSSKALNALTYRFSRVRAVVSGGRTRRKYSTPDLSRTSRNCLRKVTSRIFTPRFLSTRDDRNLKRHELGNARCVRPIAAVFVGIPSLIYLAVQIREQTKERRQSAVHALTVQWGDLTESLHDNAETAAIFLRGMQSFTDLDAVSKLRFSAFFNRLINIFEGMYFSHRQG